MGNNIRKLRKNKRLTQTELARQIGSSQQSIYKYEAGICEPDIASLKALAQFFGVSIDYIVGNSDNENPDYVVEKIILDRNEKEFILKYKQLDASAKAIVHSICDYVAMAGKLKDGGVE